MLEIVSTSQDDSSKVDGQKEDGCVMISRLESNEWRSDWPRHNYGI